MKRQTATLPESSVQDGRNYWGEKEVTSIFFLVAFDGKQQREVAQVRVHHTRNKGANYCSVWVNDGKRGRWYAGHGQASGFGYHRSSAAMAAALDSAGIKLSSPIDGVGEGAMRDALMAIGRACGYRDSRMIVLTAGA